MIRREQQRAPQSDAVAGKRERYDLPSAVGQKLEAARPSRLKDVRVDSFKNGTATVTWTASPEKGVNGYLVAYGTPAKPDGQQVRVVKPPAMLTGIAPGTIVSVKAINTKGLEGWDWARVTVR